MTRRLPGLPPVSCPCLFKPRPRIGRGSILVPLLSPVSSDLSPFPRGVPMASEATIEVRSNGHALTLPTLAFQGLPSTLCKGCGHNSITSHLIEACKAVGVNPYSTVKFSGIGCSSKTPAYFLQYSHGFNALHGRMPSVATGAAVANHSLLSIGISGDGDTANIGLGQFKHACRRNLPLIYVIENNGCYGLTKGPFAATADLPGR